MKRYRLTKSGVCDCMLPDDNGPWVKYEDAEHAHREGWEQCHRECVEIADSGPSPVTATMIAEMEYGGSK